MHDPDDHPTDRDILRGLAARQAEIAAPPIHAQTIAGWKRLNDLKPGKPMVHIYQVCWREMDVDGGLTLQCQDPFCRAAGGQLRRTIYQWNHLGAVNLSSRGEHPQMRPA